MNRPTAARHRALRVGITGPIGCGKSTIAGWLGKRPGIVVVDADQVAREVLDPGEPALAAVVARFGGGFVQADGSLDRAALGRVVFADPAALADLEAIVHPAVRPRILAAIAEADRRAASAVVIEAIKLVEGGLATLCDEVWFVSCQRATQRDRLVGRGSPDDEADQRIAAQGDLVAAIAPFATRTIDTTGSAADARRMAEAALDEALARPQRS